MTLCPSGFPTFLSQLLVTVPLPESLPMWAGPRAFQGARPGCKLRNQGSQVLVTPGPMAVACSLPSPHSRLKAGALLGISVLGLPKHPTCWGLKQQMWTCSHFWRLDVPIWDSCAQVRVWAGLVPSEDVRETVAGSRRFWSFAESLVTSPCLHKVCCPHVGL